MRLTSLGWATILKSDLFKKVCEAINVRPPPCSLYGLQYEDDQLISGK
jgi:hypothetical protein